LKGLGTSFLLFFVLCLSGALALPPPARALQASGVDAQKKANQQDSEQESGNNVYRHSPSVRWLAGILHVDTEIVARVFEYFNFAILAGAVLYGLLKFLPKSFRANRENIQHQLVDARTATQEAHERLAAIEQRLSRLDEEIAAISKQAEKDSVEDEARIKASIEVERKRIVEAVNKDIAAAGSAAQRDLKRFAAGLSVDRAAQRITLTEDDDRALMQEFAQSLGHESRGGGQS
jgi:F-type H+-transporting ATPase subunit b